MNNTEEWRPVPNFSGYVINAQGTIKDSYGYILSAKNLRLRRNGKQIYVCRKELLDLAFPPAPAPPAAANDDQVTELERRLALARRANEHLMALNKKYRAALDAQAEADAACANEDGGDCYA